MPRRSPYTILLSNDELEYLEAVAAQYTSPYCAVVRAKIVLYAALGMENQEIADRLDLPRQVVSKWRKRFCERRIEGLQDEPRAGRPPGFSPSRRGAYKKTRL
ncbi:MAG: helix-turn-helix domain-containing protein [Gemmatimonadota bacterium]